MKKHDHEENEKHYSDALKHGVHDRVDTARFTFAFWCHMTKSSVHAAYKLERTRNVELNGTSTAARRVQGPTEPRS